MAVEYPTIIRRYLSTFIDGMLIVGLLITISYIFDSENDLIIKIRVGLILIMFLVYEPFFTSFFCTLGQKITGIRIRKLSTHTKISIFQAYIRIFFKALLGIISFFTIPFSKNKRAIHDFTSGSIVICKTDHDDE